MREIGSAVFSSHCARELAEPHEHARPDRPDLRLEERLAGEDLVRLGVAVLRRPALDDVRDEDVGPRIFMPFSMMSVRSWPARPTNARPCSSSSAPGASPTNISSAPRVPLAEDDGLAAPRELAAPAVADLGADRGAGRRPGSSRLGACRLPPVATASRSAAAAGGRRTRGARGGRPRHADRAQRPRGSARGPRGRRGSSRSLSRPRAALAGGSRARRAQGDAPRRGCARPARA